MKVDFRELAIVTREKFHPGDITPATRGIGIRNCLWLEQ